MYTITRMNELASLNDLNFLFLHHFESFLYEEARTVTILITVMHVTNHLQFRIKLKNLLLKLV